MSDLLYGRCLSCAMFMPLDLHTGRCPCCAWDTPAARRARRRPRWAIGAELAQYAAFSLLLGFAFLSSAFIQIIMAPP